MPVITRKRRLQDFVRIFLIAFALILGWSTSFGKPSSAVQVDGYRFEEIVNRVNDLQSKQEVTISRVSSLEEEFKRLQALALDSRLVKIETYAQALLLMVSVLGLDRLVQVVTASRERKSSPANGKQ